MKDIIEKNLVPQHEYIFGFADLRGLLPPEYSDYNYGISIGKRLDSSIVDTLVNGPSLGYFHHYKEINEQLTRVASEISHSLGYLGIDSIPVVPTISFSQGKNKKYLETLSYDISHKMVATRAGLGWIGKTDLLISKAFGPRVRLVSILLKQDPGCSASPYNKSKCGDCNLCVLNCPAGAATGLKWDITIPRDSFFNAFKCREKCGELAKKLLNVDERICGLCVSICPVGRTKQPD